MEAARVSRVAVLFVLAASLLVACTPEPEPAPTPTGFASEAEAFAAAEQTYRAYVDAVNTVRTGQVPPTAPDGFLTGDALRIDQESRTQLEEAGLRIDGPSTVKSFTGMTFTAESASARVCLDSRQSRLLDSTDADVTPADRPETVTIEISVLWATPRPLISESAISNESC